MAATMTMFPRQKDNLFQPRTNAAPYVDEEKHTRQKGKHICWLCRFHDFTLFLYYLLLQTRPRHDVRLSVMASGLPAIIDPRTQRVSGAAQHEIAEDSVFLCVAYVYVSSSSAATSRAEVNTKSDELCRL